jgi:hypothetical protein
LTPTSNRDLSVEPKAEDEEEEEEQFDSSYVIEASANLRRRYR